MNGEKRWVRKFSYFPTGEEGVKLVESETPYTWKISAQNLKSTFCIVFLISKGASIDSSTIPNISFFISPRYRTI